jgi:hypothetical protein
VTVVPSVQAQAPKRWVQCSVGYIGGSEYVVMNYVSYDTNAWVREAGATCSTWIATGRWTGADMYNDWEAEGYDFLCKAVFGPGEAVDVYAFPYYRDRLVGYETCESASALGGRIEYQDVGPARDSR